MKLKNKDILLGAILGFALGLASYSIHQNYSELERVKEELRKLQTENEELSYSKKNLELALGRKIQTHTQLATSDELELSNSERECLLKNVFYEAGIEPIAGKIAVAQVTFNRLDSGKWGNTVCDVVYARSQFSWTKRDSLETPSGILWEQTKKAVDLFERGVRLSPIADSLYYHAEWVSEPRWAKDEYKLAQIGQHIFYKDVNQ